MKKFCNVSTQMQVENYENSVSKMQTCIFDSLKTQ